MNDVPKVAILVGGLLCLLAAGGYVYAMLTSAYASWTALIPAFAGVPIFVCGLIANGRSDAVRKHAMHVALLVALLGTLAPLGRLPRTLAAEPLNVVAVVSMFAMMALCALFLLVGVRSFIAARRARTAGE